MTTVFPLTGTSKVGLPTIRRSASKPMAGMWCRTSMVTTVRRSTAPLLRRKAVQRIVLPSSAARPSSARARPTRRAPMIHMARRWATRKLPPRAPTSVGRMRRLSSRLTCTRPGMRARRADSRRVTGIHCLGSTARAYPAEARELQRRLAGDLPADFAQDVRALTDKVREKAATIASRKASQDVIEALAPGLPELLGGSADLAGSNLTMWSGSQVDRQAGRQLYPLRRARVWHGGHHEWHRPAWRIHSLRGHLPDLLRLLSQCPAHGRVDEDPLDLRVYARLHRVGRGWADPPGCRACCFLAADSQHGRVASL